MALEALGGCERISLMIRKAISDIFFISPSYLLLGHVLADELGAPLGLVAHLMGRRIMHILVLWC